MILRAAGDTVDIDADITTNGGTIDIRSGGAIDTSAGSLNTSFNPGSGDITLIADSGDITVGELSSSSDLGEAGTILLKTPRDITTGNIFASSAISGTGGDITLLSGETIDTTAGELNTISVQGEAGAILLDATDDITAGDLFASSINLSGIGNSNTGGSGGITLSSVNGNISTGGLLSPTQASFGSAGSSKGITVTANNGSITANGLVWAFSSAAVDGGAGDSGNGGGILFSAKDDINIAGSIQTSSRSNAGNAGNGSPVSITSTNGNISITDSILSSSNGSGSSGNGGTVTLSAAGSTSTRDIDSSSAGSGQGGDITLDSGDVTDTSAGTLDSSSNADDGGTISLTTQGGSITTGTLTSRTFGGPGSGGNITLTVNTGPASIDTTAGELNSFSANGDGGDITLITQDGDITTGTLFSRTAIGNSGGDISVTINGTTGAINTRAGLLDSGSNIGLGGGDIELTAPIGITVGSIDANGSKGTGNIALKSDEIDLRGGDSSVQSQGALALQPFTADQDIFIGVADDTNVNLLELSVTDWNAIKDEFTSFAIGRSDGVDISIGPAGISANNNLILQTGGTIVANGLIQTTGSLRATAPDIVLQDVTTSGFQDYNGSVTFNSHYETAGGNFLVLGDALLADNTSVTTNGGHIVFDGAVDATTNGSIAQTLTLTAGSTGNVSFKGDVGKNKPLDSVTINSAGDIALNKDFIAGPTEFFYVGDLTSSDPSLDVKNLEIDPSAASATIFGIVAGFSGQDAALAVTGPIGDPNFTINGFIIGAAAPSPPSVVEPEDDPAPEPQPTDIDEEPAKLIEVEEIEIAEFAAFYEKTRVWLPEEFNMSDFSIEARVKAGWPLIVDFELERLGVVRIEITAEDVETVTFQLPGTTGRNTTIVNIPQRFGGDSKLASIRVTATEREDLDLVPLRLYGIGAGPKAVGGSMAIDEILFTPPYLRAIANEASAYRFFSHSDFDTVMVDFCHVTPSRTGDKYRSVNYHLISEGVEADEWIGEEKKRVWNGQDEYKRVSVGLHKLQIRAWDEAGEWLTVWSESFIEVQ